MCIKTRRKMFNNYHTHTNYCDGKASAEEMVLKAISLGCSDLGFSSHAPLQIKNTWSMVMDKMCKYCNDISSLKEKYRGDINIFLGLEYDFIYNKSFEFKEIKDKFNIDYGIGSVHLVCGENSEIWFIDGPSSNYRKGVEIAFDGDVKKAIKSYYTQLKDMIKTQEFDIIGHFDKVKVNNKESLFCINENWYKQEVEETLCLIKERGLIVEANTRGIYTNKYNGLYPEYDILKKCFSMNIPVVVSTDAHKTDDLNKSFFDTVSLLKEIGYDSLMRFNGKEWYPQKINI